MESFLVKVPEEWIIIATAFKVRVGYKGLSTLSMESFLVMVPEEWMMLASSSFIMKLTVF
jgi:hypothetical protein